MIKSILGLLVLTLLADVPYGESTQTSASPSDDLPSKTLFDADSIAIHYYQEYCGNVCRYDEDRFWFRRIGSKRTIGYTTEIKKGGWCLDGGSTFDDLEQSDIETHSATAFQWLDKRLQPVDSSRVIVCWIYVNDSVLSCSGEDYRAFKERLLRSVRR
ncbi:MAG: hypothetical protein JNN32_04425 [Flavobacteriales bacterium]|nr:hypothetical protein [Flavobacteriales bacterium]